MTDIELMKRDFIVMLRAGTGDLDEAHDRALARLESAFRDRKAEYAEFLATAKYIRRSLKAPQSSDAHKAAQAFLDTFPTYGDK